MTKTTKKQYKKKPYPRYFLESDRKDRYFQALDYKSVEVYYFYRNNIKYSAENANIWSLTHAKEIREIFESELALLLSL